MSNFLVIKRIALLTVGALSGDAYLSDHMTIHLNQTVTKFRCIAPNLPQWDQHLI
jgi:hypothetical protein